MWKVRKNGFEHNHRGRRGAPVRRTLRREAARLDLPTKMRTTKRPKTIPLRVWLSLASRQKGSPDNPVHIQDPELGKWTSRLVGWTCALVFTAVVSAGISFFTLRSINGQLNEMQAEQRPWVYAADVQPAGRIVLADGRYAIPLKFSIQEYGSLARLLRDTEDICGNT